MNLKLYLISSISPGLSISPRYTNRACLCKDSTKIQAREAAGTRAMAQLGASRWPEIPAARNASISRHQARPASCPTVYDRLPGKPARPDGTAAGPDGPAHGRRPGKPAAGRNASRECRTGERETRRRTGWGLMRA